jgi:four helix bundle protein
MKTFAERFAEFEKAPPPDLFGDPIWRLPAYRIALFFSHIISEDVSQLLDAHCPGHIVGQLERSIDSVGVNISEGYSRFSGRERARYYEIALGSARESRDWYRRSASWLGNAAALERGLLLTRAIKVLMVAIPQERAGSSEDRIRRTIRKPLAPPGPSTSTNPSPSPSTSPSPSPSTLNQD